MNKIFSISKFCFDNFSILKKKKKRFSKSQISDFTRQVVHIGNKSQNLENSQDFKNSRFFFLIFLCCFFSKNKYIQFEKFSILKKKNEIENFQNVYIFKIEKSFFFFNIWKIEDKYWKSEIFEILRFFEIFKTFWDCWDFFFRNARNLSFVCKKKCLNLCFQKIFFQHSAFYYIFCSPKCSLWQILRIKWYSGKF